MVKFLPNNGSIANTLGYLLAEQNKELNYAEKLVKKALQVDKPNRATYYDSLAWVYYREGKINLAKKNQIKALKIFNLAHQATSSEVNLHMGKIYEKLQKYSKAVKYYKMAIKSDSDKDAVKTAALAIKTLSGKK